MYHLEGSEAHISMIKVKLLINNLETEIDGNIHLCTRSIFFEPLDLAEPILKLKYSNPLAHKFLDKIEKSKLRSNVMLELKEQGLATLEKKSFFVSLEKLYNKPKNDHISSSARSKTEKLSNILLLTTEKIFTTQRDPITPYSSERLNLPLLFEIGKENSVHEINKFLKLLDYILKHKNDDNLTKTVIESQINEAFRDLMDSHSNHEQQIQVYKARRILPEGVIYGVMTIHGTESLIFHPIVNKIYHEPLEIKFSRIKGILRYRYLFRHTAVEIWSYNSKHSVLLDFNDNGSRETIFNHIKKNATKKQENLFSRDYVLSLWLNGHISNFEYLMFLNTISNRSFNDLSQYPIFPWVISDFHSEKLNLNDPETFRDFTRPVGAINKSRLQRFRDGYEDQIKSKFGETPYLYPTHYSTPGFVVYFLIRKIPEFIIRLQNGVFGPAERIFRSFESCWDMTVNQGPDLKELIPEFYCLDSDFLVNFDKILLGVTPEGELIDDVILPMWAKNPSDFLQRMRAGLECDHVSANLHHWIDLIFGEKQKGEQAVSSNNLFYPLCYEENVQWSKIKSTCERDAVEIQLTEFGQIPVQVFDFPHPAKRTRLVNIYKIPKELYHEDRESLRGRIHAANQEIDKLKGEIEYIKQEYVGALKKQGDDYKRKDDAKLKELVKKIDTKEEEIEILKKELHKSKDPKQHKPEVIQDFEDAVAKVHKEYEEKIEWLQSRLEDNNHIKDLEKQNNSLRKKLRTYEDALHHVQKDHHK